MIQVTMLAPFAFTPKATVNARTFPMAQALVARGHKVRILVPPYDNLGDAGKTIEQDGIRIDNLPIARVSALTPLAAAWRLSVLARRQRSDIIHVFKPVGYAALAGMILASTSRIPIVTDTDDWEGTGGWSSVNPYPTLWKRFFDFQERWMPRHSAAITVASRTLQTQVWGMGVPPSRVFYVPNCPGTPFLERMRQVCPSDPERIRRELGIGGAPMAIYVGHITLGDDLDLALAAFRKVRESLPGARLVVVGTGDGLERLKALAREMSLSEATVFTGWVEHQEVPAYLSAANAAIYPYRDTLINRAKCSIKILEYMAMGKAIVTHRVGQNLEYLEHGRSGFLADPGSVDAFAEGLLAVLSDPAYAQRMGAEAARRIEREFNWTHRVVEVERAYHRAHGQE